MKITKQNAKKAAKFAVGWSASWCVYNAIKNNTVPKNKINQIEILIGSLVLSSLVAASAEKHFSEQWDIVAVSLEKVKSDHQSS